MRSLLLDVWFFRTEHVASSRSVKKERDYMVTTIMNILGTICVLYETGSIIIKVVKAFIIWIKRKKALKEIKRLIVTDDNNEPYDA